MLRYADDTEYCPLPSLNRVEVGAMQEQKLGFRAWFVLGRLPWKLELQTGFDAMNL